MDALAALILLTLAIRLWLLIRQERRLIHRLNASATARHYAEAAGHHTRRSR